MNDNARLRGVLLDLDGTIADSIEFFYGLACEMVAAANCAAPARSEVLDAIANGLVPHERFLPPDFPDREAFLGRLYRDHFPNWIRRYGTETEPLMGAVETVRVLERRGLRLALVTSSSGPLPFLDRWGIRASFAAIIGRDDVRRIKPDPEALLLALGRLGLDPSEVVNVGDTPLDVRAGLAAGVTTVGVLTGAGTEHQLRAAGASQILQSLAELPNFLDRSFFDKDAGSCDTRRSGRRSTRS
ncbi:MAG TPA: HAD family hydrolase [Candidatus Binatia bacterium]|nr:HAD family hydrolase [Candidatus Binatia bacterium]